MLLPGWENAFGFGDFSQLAMVALHGIGGVDQAPDLRGIGVEGGEIAAKLAISEKTVKTHLSNILGKLSLDDRTQAAIYALCHGLSTEKN